MLEVGVSSASIHFKILVCHEKKDPWTGECERCRFHEVWDLGWGLWKADEDS